MILATLGASSFAAGLLTRQGRLEQSLVILAKARQAQASPVDAAALAEQWPALGGEERRLALGRLIDCVIVERGTAPVIERAWIYRPGKGPIVRIHGRLVTSSASIGGDGERLHQHRRWSAARLEKELRRFLAGRREWPTYREFADSGRARLFAQVLAYGGPHYWGHRFGLHVPPRCVRWNRERVRAALSPFLEGRVAWPGARAFAEAGMRPVYRAAEQYGGIPFWAGEFGLPQGKALRPGWPEERIAKSSASSPRAAAIFRANPSSWRQDCGRSTTRSASAAESATGRSAWNWPSSGPARAAALAPSPRRRLFGSRRGACRRFPRAIRRKGPSTDPRSRRGLSLVARRLRPRLPGCGPGGRELHLAERPTRADRRLGKGARRETRQCL